MTLDNMFAAARGKMTDDKKYEVGQISEKTGLQKQPDGSWAPPKNGGKKPLSRQDNTAFKNNELKRTLNNNVSELGPKKDVSAENRAANEKADKERADRKAKADSKASAARQEAESRHLSGVEMKDFFLAKAYEGASVEMTQRGLEAQGFDLLEANDDVNVYERPEGGRITMKLEGNRIKSADYQTPAETSAEARKIYGGPNPLPSGKDYTQKAPGKMQNAVNYLNGKTEDPAEVNEFLKNNGFKKAGEENTIRMAGGPLKETTYQDAAGNKVTLRTYEKDGKQAAALKYEGSTAETAREARSERANPVGSKEPPKRESVSAGRMQKDLDGNFWSRPDDFKEDITSRGWDVDEMNSEYAVISNEAGSQYEVRFDPHSDDGDLTVRTFKPLMIDEDDDDVEDSAPAPRELTRDTKIRVRRDQVTDKKYMER